MSFKSVQIRLFIKNSLIFFSLLVLASCSEEPDVEISIIWENEQAVGLAIPSSLLDQPDFIQLTVRLVQEGNGVPMLGKLEKIDLGTRFTPLIPFTRGQRYELLYGGLSIGNVAIPDLDEKEAKVSLLEVYPTQDTLPENQLKLFLKFSEPMREGESMRYLTLLTGKNDTLKGVFLDLQPELWNSDRKLLTVWLDPGRIKRDLIPNLEMGAPLETGQSYRLLISDRWKGKLGGRLDQSYSKDFIVTDRDSISPNPPSWDLAIPKAGTTDAIVIDFLEALDFSLLQEVFRIKSSENQELAGKWEIGLEEKSVRFTPENPWKKGKYTIAIESRLEDLAGNNLNRLFETDLLNQAKPADTSGFKVLKFDINE